MHLMGGVVELAEMTWCDARRAIQEADIALLPVGAIEQHGPHLPLGTDWYIARHIALATATLRDLLLLPGISVGVSVEHRQFWGTLSVSPDALRDQAVAIARAVAVHGLQRVVFVNGHGSNCAPLDEAAQALRGDGVHAFVFNWWQAVRATLATVFPEPTAHAGSIETSLMWVIDPSLVREDRFDEASATVEWGRFVEGVQVAFDALDFSTSGNVGDPSLADADKGKLVLDAVIDKLARFCDWLGSRKEEDLKQRPHLP